MEALVKQSPAECMGAGSRGLAPRWCIFLLSCRDPMVDFRLPLAYELDALGHDVFYVVLRRRPTVVHLSAKADPQEMNLSAFIYFMTRTCRSAPKCLVFNSTNLLFPGLSLILKWLSGGLWCFDIHDDLLYDYAGKDLTVLALSQRILLWMSDFTVHAAPTLAELFPRSWHLGNASAVAPITREQSDFGRVLVLSSIDPRFDSRFLADAAALCPNVRFEIYGQVLPDVPGAKSSTRLDDLIRLNPNVRYAGVYTNQDLPRILSMFSISLAPYVTESRLTRYLDPLRYYHCLNAGLEVATTDIPQGRVLADHLHVVRSPREFTDLLERLRRDPSARRNAGAARSFHSWREKAERLLEIASEVDRDRDKVRP